MRSRRAATLAAGALAGLALVSVVGYAAGLGTASATLGAGKSSIASCDTDGVGVTQVLTVNNVTSVTVSGIAAACATGLLSVSVNNQTTSNNGSAVVPAGGGSVTVALVAAVAMRDADEIDVTITGP